MKKILICILLLTFMLTCMLPVYAAGEEMTVEVRASKTDVRVGDTVEYTVLATGKGVVAMQFQVMMPDGLRYVEKSAATPEKLAQKLGVPAAEWTEKSMMFTFYNDVGISFPKGTEILHFSCVAEKEGNWDVILYELLPFNSEFLDFPATLKVQTVQVRAKINEQVPPVTQESAPAVTAPSESVPTTAPKPTDPVTEPVGQTTQSATVPEQTEEPTVDVIVTEPAVQTPSSEPTGTEPSGETENATEPDQTREHDEQPEKKNRLWLIPVIGVPVAAAALAAILLIRRKTA